jgi:multidrug efflux pump subunit AcrA (membrane-fusion protein)
MLKKLLKTGQRRWLVLFPLLGFIILVIMVKLKSAPQLKSEVELTPLVNVEKAKVRNLQMSIEGYGRAQSKEIWQAVAEVSGRVIYRHPDLEKGKIMPAGTVLLKIDPVDYQLKLAQAKSDLKSAIADADRVALNKNKYTLSLELEKSRLIILEKEYKRKKGILNKGAISQSLVDQEQSNVFAQQENVLDLSTSLQLIPNDIDVAQARIQVNQSQVKEAERKLDKTNIVLPFDARITQVNAVLEQVINQQSVLLEANYIGAMEINAQFAITDMKQFVRQMVDTTFSQDNKFPDIKRLNLQAGIKLYAGDESLEWLGSVERVSDSIDFQGNTIGLIVEMANDWKDFDPLNNTPVMNNMFLEVEVLSEAKPMLSIPTKAIHGQSVYIVKDNVLRIKPISILFESGRYTAIDDKAEGSISLGDLVITTDLLPAIDKMQVRTLLDRQEVDQKEGKDSEGEQEK